MEVKKSKGKNMKQAINNEFIVELVELMARYGMCVRNIAHVIDYKGHVMSIEAMELNPTKTIKQIKDAFDREKQKIDVIVNGEVIYGDK